MSFRLTVQTFAERSASSESRRMMLSVAESPRGKSIESASFALPLHAATLGVSPVYSLR